MEVRQDAIDLQIASHNLLGGYRGAVHNAPSEKDIEFIKEYIKHNYNYVKKLSHKYLSKYLEIEKMSKRN